MMMEAEAASNGIRLFAVGDSASPTPRHVRKWAETRPVEGLEIEIEQGADLHEALDRLSNHSVDLIAVSARLWNDAVEVSDTIVATALPRREENHILVANDRPAFLPHKSIILAPNRLQRRQLRRYRADFRVMDPRAFADEVGLTHPEGDALVIAEWLEELRGTGTITGYVSERHLFSAAAIDARRHTLMTDPREGETVRFLPSPLHGLTLLIARPGFPPSLAERIGDAESATAWSCEQILLQGVSQSIHDRVGMIVRHRQIGSLLKQAEVERDLLRSTSLLDAEGDIVDPAPLVEVLLEAVGRTGERTLLLERLVRMVDASTAVRLMLNDWDTMLDAVTAEHEEDIRLGPQRPAFLDL
jgi:hypothetical protein